jgi:WD40 repeat protein/tetratricopeptide (TPR) repeat protein
MAAGDMTSDHVPLDLLAEEFVERHRRGERPALTDYIERHPHWADEIRELFPSLVTMERLKPAPDEPSGSSSGAFPFTAQTIDRLGDYRIVREIGHGGMGIVYEAVQESLDRHVALKVLGAHVRTDAGLLERFRLEARSAARLHHTNIVPVFDIGEHDGVYYYSMQFIHGHGLDIILKCLAKDPQDRFPSAADLREELVRVVENRPTRTRPLSRPAQLWRWCKRNPLVAGLCAVAASLVIVIAVVSSAAAIRNSRLATVANQNLAQARKNLVQAYMTQAAASRVSRRVGQRFEPLAAIERAMELASQVEITEADRLRLRNEAIAALALPDLRPARELDVPQSTHYGLALDPPFARYAFKLDDGTVIVRRLADDAELMRLTGLPPSLHQTSAAFSPDGRYLAMTSGVGEILQVWDLEEQKLVLTERAMATVNAVNWSFRPDGRELALARTDKSVVVYELPSGRLKDRWKDATGSFGTVAYSPDGSKLAIRATDLTIIQIVSSEGARQIATLKLPSTTSRFVWNPRRRNLLAVACDNNVIYIRDVDTGKQVMALSGESFNGLVIAYHPAGELLASRGWQQVLRLWDTRTGRQVLRLSSSWSPSITFDRTGRWLGVDGTAEKARILEVADAAECRNLVREPFREVDRHGALAIDPTGDRAVTTGSAVTVWDLNTGSTLATLPASGNAHTILFDREGAVLTGHPALLRWPITEVPDEATTIGPPEVLHPRGTMDGFAITPNGRTIAAAMYNDGGLVFDARKPEHARWLPRHPDVRYIAISPDSRWCVTGSQHPLEGMKLWDAQTARVIHDFPGIPKEVVVRSFSPDGRWLAVRWDGWVLFDTTTWTLRARLTRGIVGCLTFAPDSRSVLCGDNASTLILVEVETGRELARFEDPEQASIDSAAFTPDGSHLVITLMDRPYLRAWDLRPIRRRLAGLGLDWNAPALHQNPHAPRSFASQPEPSGGDRRPPGPWIVVTAGPPERIVEWATNVIQTKPGEVYAHRRRGLAYCQLKRFDEATADFSAALEAQPDDDRLLLLRAIAHAGGNHTEAVIADGENALRLARAEPTPPAPMAERETLAFYCNDQAWKFVKGAASGLDPPRAVSLAHLAVELNPGQPTYLNTLGVALYRAARYSEAVAVLERSLPAGKGQIDAFDLFFLAMARRRLGQVLAARADFDRAVRWVDTHPNLDPVWLTELKSFRAEAEAVLARAPGELPADVLSPRDESGIRAAYPR